MDFTATGAGGAGCEGGGVCFEGELFGFLGGRFGDGGFGDFFGEAGGGEEVAFSEPEVDGYGHEADEYDNRRRGYASYGSQ